VSRVDWIGRASCGKARTAVVLGGIMTRSSLIG
jgi:hypothetical protein